MTKIKISLTPTQMLDMIRTHLAEVNDISEDEIEVTMNTLTFKVWIPTDNAICIVKSISELPKNTTLKIVV